MAVRAGVSAALLLALAGGARAQCTFQNEIDPYTMYNDLNGDDAAQPRTRTPVQDAPPLHITTGECAASGYACMKQPEEADVIRSALVLAFVPVLLACAFVLVASIGAGDVVHKKTKKPADILFGSTGENLLFGALFYAANAILLYLVFRRSLDATSSAPLASGSGLVPSAGNASTLALVRRVSSATRFT